MHDDRVHDEDHADQADDDRDHAQIDAAVMDVIKATVAQITGGKGTVTNVTKA